MEFRRYGFPPEFFRGIRRTSEKKSMAEFQISMLSRIEHVCVDPVFIYYCRFLRSLFNPLTLMAHVCLCPCQIVLV